MHAGRPHTIPDLKEARRSEITAILVEMLEDVNEKLERSFAGMLHCKRTAFIGYSFSYLVLLCITIKLPFISDKLPFISSQFAKN